MESGSITLSKKQQRRAEVLNRILSGKITKDEASSLLELSRRQLNRVLGAYRLEGLPSLVHGNAGKVPVNTLSVATIVALAGEDGKYHKFNVCHMCDLLADNEAIRLGRSTLTRLLRENNVIEARYELTKGIARYFHPNSFRGRPYDVSLLD